VYTKIVHKSFWGRGFYIEQEDLERVLSERMDVLCDVVIPCGYGRRRVNFSKVEPQLSEPPDQDSSASDTRN